MSLLEMKFGRTYSERITNALVRAYEVTENEEHWYDLCDNILYSIENYINAELYGFNVEEMIDDEYVSDQECEETLDKIFGGMK